MRKESTAEIRCLPEVRSEALTIAARAVEIGRELFELSRRQDELEDRVGGLVVDPHDGVPYVPLHLVDNLRRELRSEHGLELSRDAIVTAGDAVERASGAGTPVRPFTFEELEERLGLSGSVPALARQENEACGCHWSNRSYHDRLVRIEQLPAGEALVLAAELGQDELNEADGHFGWCEWEAFAAAHNWSDPLQIGEIFSRFGNLAEAWQERRRASVDSRVVELEQDVDRLRRQVLQHYSVCPAAQASKGLAGCGCPACKVLLPLLIAGEHQAAIDIDETMDPDRNWDSSLLGEEDRAVDERWQEIWGRIRRLPGDDHLAHDADTNRGDKLLDGTRQGARYGAAMLVRQLQKRYEVASASARRSSVAA